MNAVFRLLFLKPPDGAIELGSGSLLLKITNLCHVNITSMSLQVQRVIKASSNTETEALIQMYMYALSCLLIRIGLHVNTHTVRPCFAVISLAYSPGLVVPF